MGNPLAVSVKAGIAYGLAVFAIGCVLGAIRVLLLAPRVGPTMAVSAEVPIILMASWFLCSLLMRRLGVGAEIGARIVVGAVAFAVLMSLEVALAVGLFHRPIGGYLAGLRSLAGAIGLAAQVCFATFPLASAIKRQRLNP